MYNKETVRRMISRKGLQETLKILSDPNFPEYAKEDLAKDFIFVGGYPNLELISSLA